MEIEPANTVDTHVNSLGLRSDPHDRVKVYIKQEVPDNCCFQYPQCSCDVNVNNNRDVLLRQTKQENEQPFTNASGVLNSLKPEPHQLENAQTNINEAAARLYRTPEMNIAESYLKMHEKYNLDMQRHFVSEFEGGNDLQRHTVNKYNADNDVQRHISEYGGDNDIQRHIASTYKADDDIQRHIVNEYGGDNDIQRHIVSTYKADNDVQGHIANEYNGEHITKQQGATGDVFHCTQCDYSHRLRHKVSYHVRMNHDPTAEHFKCTLCDYTTKFKSNLSKHMNGKHELNSELHKCPDCDFTTKLKAYLSMHVRRNHDVDAPVYVCAECTYTTKYKSSLLDHASTRHPKGAELMPCPQCDFAATSKYRLAYHLKVEHDPRAALLTCTACDYTTRHKSSLVVHMRQHDPSRKPHKCPVCGCTFQFKYYLKLHVTLKHDTTAKTLKCSQCNYTTKLKSYLTKHTSVNHNPNKTLAESLQDCKYKCTQCEFKTTLKRCLTRHVRQNHNSHFLVYQCDDMNEDGSVKRVKNDAAEMQHALCKYVSDAGRNGDVDEVAIQKNPQTNDCKDHMYDSIQSMSDNHTDIACLPESTNDDTDHEQTAKLNSHFYTRTNENDNYTTNLNSGKSRVPVFESVECDDATNDDNLEEVEQCMAAAQHVLCEYKS